MGQRTMCAFRCSGLVAEETFASGQVRHRGDDRENPRRKARDKDINRENSRAKGRRCPSHEGLGTDV